MANKYCLIALSATALLASDICVAEVLHYSSGTGFFIGRDGYVLTSNHVVKNCRSIAVVGAVPLADATLAAHDETYDLALLKAQALPSEEASLSSERQPLKAGDPVVIVGYPGQSWETLQVVTRSATIVDTKGPHGEEKWLEFSDSLASGQQRRPAAR